MTNEQIRRIEQTIRETYVLLGKELSYQPRFRNQERIDFYLAHLDMLQARLPALAA